VTQLRAEGIVAGYGSVQILHGVSVSAGEGQVSCIFGPNGCGKSTLLKAIAGAIDTWKGRVSLDGDDITGLPSHAVLSRGLALMPQGGGVFAQLSVRDNLRMGGYTLRSRHALDERIDELLEEFPRLRERLSVNAGNLSGGEQMMLAIARALIVRPRLSALPHSRSAAWACSWSSRTSARPPASPTGSSSWSAGAIDSRDGPPTSRTIGSSCECISERRSRCSPQ
jgi:ABC-type branched-subunit amino acid transport system ATPase component